MKYFFLLVSFGAAWLVWADNHRPIVVCASSVKVEKIVQLHYRDALILLSNGQQIWVNQASLSPGDDMCLEWKRE